MVKRIITTIILFTIFYNNSEAQLFNLGIGLEPYVTSTDHYVWNHNLGVNYYIDAIIIPIPKIEFETRFGFAFPNDLFSGYSISLFFKFFPFNKFYFTVGHKWHWNFSSSHNSGGLVGGLYKLPAIGLGYKYKNFYIESLYYKPNRKNLEYYYSYLTSTIVYPRDFKSVISINFIVSWSIL